MKKIFIIHENDEWVTPLEVELRKINVPFEKWHMNSTTLNMNSSPPLGVFYNRMSASSHTRGHLSNFGFFAITFLFPPDFDS